MLKRAFVLLLLLMGSSALAHATLVIGEAQVTPDTPEPNEPFALTVTLQDPTQVPVEDAVIFAELRPQGEPDAEPVRVDLEETDVGGTYEGTATLPEAGAYTVFMRDQTYRQEEASATLAEPLTVGDANAVQGFVFPPTAVGGASLRTWLLWLIGLPLVAGAVVTVLVLTRGDDAPKTA